MRLATAAERPRVEVTLAAAVALLDTRLARKHAGPEGRGRWHRHGHGAASHLASSISGRSAGALTPSTAQTKFQNVFCSIRVTK
jgi:hypothetical protein